jgi:hypothetical protein
MFPVTSPVKLPVTLPVTFTDIVLGKPICNCCPVALVSISLVVPTIASLRV